MRTSELRGSDCGIAQALGVLGDGWGFLILREIAAGTTRFDAIAKALGISRRALTETLASLQADGILQRSAYQEHPPRYEYELTAMGSASLPVLLALQEWGDRFVAGDGTLTARPTDAEAQRAAALVGTKVPTLSLQGHDGARYSLSEPGTWSVLFLFPGAFAPAEDGYPAGWGSIEGTAGCTIEATSYAAAEPALRAQGVRILGVSTQRSEQQARFAEHAGLNYPLLSDADAQFAVALRLPVFRVGGLERYKRVSLLIDGAGIIRAVQAPITDPEGSIDEMLRTTQELMA